jgi:hypothetical protein
MYDSQNYHLQNPKIVIDILCLGTALLYIFVCTLACSISNIPMASPIFFPELVLLLLLVAASSVVLIERSRSDGAALRCFSRILPNLCICSAEETNRIRNLSLGCAARSCVQFRASSSLRDAINRVVHIDSSEKDD